MKMDLDELSLGSEATAEATVLNSPEVVVPARTTIAPDGGEVRDAARTVWQNENAMTRDSRRMFGVFNMVESLTFEVALSRPLNKA